MPIYGRSAAYKSNLVRNPPVLPVPLFYGSLNWTIGFEQQPQATLEYKGVPIEDLPRLEAVYKVGNLVTLQGLPFEVSSYTYNKERFVRHDVIKTNVYAVSVALTWRYARAVDFPVKAKRIAGVRAKDISIGAIAGAAKVPYIGPQFSVDLPDESDMDFTITLKSAVETKARTLGCFVEYGAGIGLKRLEETGNWAFDANEVLSDGANTLAIPAAYNETELTGAFTDGGGEEEPAITPKLEFVKKEPKIERIVEEDENVTSPPLGSRVLRTLDSNADASGPKKSKKITTTVDGTPETEELWIYGFSYTAKNIHAGDGLLFSSNPQAFWGVIEYQKTQYVYQKLPPIELRVTLVDPKATQIAVSTGQGLSAVIHPDYKQFVSGDIIGKTLSFNLQTLYLTEISTSGYKKCRFKKESSTETLEEDHPYYQAFQFKNIPFESKTRYLLKSARTTYGDNVGSPFSIEWYDYKELEPKIKKEVDTFRSIAPNGRVAVLTPDPNYVEPMLVWTESSASSSFAYMPDPESEPEKPEPPLVTGEESYSRTDRVKVTDNKYKEKLTSFSAQDPGFSSSLEEIKFRDVLGRPPEAQTRQAQWEQKERTDTRTYQFSNKPKKLKRYYLTSDFSEFAIPGNSVSYEGAKTLTAARLGAATDLRIQDMQGNQESKLLSWYYPAIKVCDRVATGDDRFARYTWRVMTASWQLEFNGVNNKYGLFPVCTTEGTQVTLGLDRIRQIQVTEKLEDAAGDDASSGDDFQLRTTATSGEKTLGGIVFKSPNRRKF